MSTMTVLLYHTHPLSLRPVAHPCRGSSFRYRNTATTQTAIRFLSGHFRSHAFSLSSLWKLQLACQASRAVFCFEIRGREGKTEHMQLILTLFWKEPPSPSGCGHCSFGERGGKLWMKRREEERLVEELIVERGRRRAHITHGRHLFGIV